MQSATNTKNLIRREFPVLAGAFVTAAMLIRDETCGFAVANIALQIVLFGMLACVPAWRTHRMSYVDIAWPLGLVTLGALTFAFSDRGSFVIAVAIVYLLMGARMGIGALTYWRKGEFDEELPRYRFQRKRWARASFGSERRDLIAEILVQCSANMGALAVPAALAVGAEDMGITPVGIVGVALWSAFFMLESVADLQKLRFGVASRKLGLKRSCDVGLWRYSRHPNYFFQWVQWNAIVVLCAPAAIGLLHESVSVTAVITVVGLVAASASMYWCLVYYTGAVPAEFYSAQSRADYPAYQARTNRFFPWFPAESGSNEHRDVMARADHVDRQVD